MEPQEPVVVVLAAGRGARFRAGGTRTGHKLLEPFGLSTVLATTLVHAVQSGLPVLAVTTEPLREQVESVVPARDVVLLPAADSVGTGLPLGIGYSIATGVAACSHAPGWLILPGDMPLVQPGTLRAVAAGLDQHPVAYAQYRGQRGHPVAFAAELYSELATLAGDDGGRRLVARYPSLGVDVSDAGVLMDLDTQDDLERLRALQAG